MASEGEKKKLLTKAPPTVDLEKTICIEWFRLIAFIALASLFIAANIFSKKFVFFPDDEDEDGSRRSLLSSALRGATGEVRRRLGGSFVMFGQEHPYVHMEDTQIFKTFGLPHTCSYIDYNPAKEIGAILLPFFSFPMTIFLILAHYRNQLVYANDPESKEAKDLYWYSRVTTYFTVAVIQLTHLWFVNDPEETYPKAFGFVGHYIPYALFQTSLAVIAIMQVKYDIIVRQIPFGVSSALAQFYVVYLIFLTVVYQAVVVAVLIDKPIIDARNGGWELTVFKILVKAYALASMLVPIACSIWTIKRSGDTNSFKMSIQ
jgi:hypothetical protein